MEEIMGIGIEGTTPTQGNDRVNELAHRRNDKIAEQREEKMEDTRQKTQSVKNDGVDFTI